MAVVGLERTLYQVSDDVGVVEVCAIVYILFQECITLCGRNSKSSLWALSLSYLFALTKPARSSERVSYHNLLLIAV